MHNDLDILMRLAVAAVLSGVLGWERESWGKQAGLRTHILVGVSAALFVALADAVVDHFGRGAEDFQYDPIRILEAVATGISFLGAGMIFVSRSGGETVKGLTTAAAIWATAGVGVATGLRRYIVAAGATLLVFLVLRLLGRWEARQGGAPVAAREQREARDGQEET